MSLFSGLFKPRDKPVNRTAGSNSAFCLDTSASGKAVNERTTMQMTAVYYYAAFAGEGERDGE